MLGGGLDLWVEEPNFGDSNERLKSVEEEATNQLFVVIIIKFGTFYQKSKEMVLERLQIDASPTIYLSNML